MKPPPTPPSYSEPEENDPVQKTEDTTATVVPPDEDMLTSEAKINREHASTTTTGPTVQEFTPPPFTGQVEEEKPEGPPNPADHKFANPGVKDAPPHVKEEGADFVADKLLIGYGKLKKTIAGMVVLVSEKKLDKWEEQGLVNRNILLPLRGGGAISAGVLIEQHNDSAEAIIDENALSKKFYDTAKPMITEELSKRNIALSNIQMLGVVTAMDLFEFGEKIKPLFEQRQEMIQAFKGATAAYKAAPQNFTPSYAQTARQQSAGNNNNSGGNEPPPVSQPVPEPPPINGAGNVDTAFDDLQGGDHGFMNPGPTSPLPPEFNQMGAAPIKAPRIPGTRIPRKRKKRKTVKANSIS